MSHVALPAVDYQGISSCSFNRHACHWALICCGHCYNCLPLLPLLPLLSFPAPPQQFFGGVDEAWFRLVHVAIEAAAAPAIAALKPLQAAVRQVGLNCLTQVVAVQQNPDA